MDWPVGASRAVVFNTEAAYLYLTDSNYRADADVASEIFCDGVGLQFYTLVRFFRVLPRKHGPDIFHAYLQSRSGARVLFVGGGEPAHAALRLRYPSFFQRNNTTHDTRQLRNDDDFGAAAREIANGGYQDVLIFLGLRRQERLQRLLHAEGYQGSSIGLGAAIDFVSGVKTRAGSGWQKAGLEWLPRLIREPRMLPRVLRSFALFPYFFDRRNALLRAYVSRERTQTRA